MPGPKDPAYASGRGADPVEPAAWSGEAGPLGPAASSLKSAARKAWVDRARASRIGFSSGRPRRSASATAACSHVSIVMW